MTTRIIFKLNDQHTIETAFHETFLSYGVPNTTFPLIKRGALCLVFYILHFSSAPLFSNCFTVWLNSSPLQSVLLSDFTLAKGGHQEEFREWERGPSTCYPGSLPAGPLQVDCHFTKLSGGIILQVLHSPFRAVGVTYVHCARSRMFHHYFYKNPA